eukprot:202816-Rhodomonas_salina.3
MMLVLAVMPSMSVNSCTPHTHTHTHTHVSMHTHVNIRQRVTPDNYPTIVDEHPPEQASHRMRGAGSSVRVSVCQRVFRFVLCFGLRPGRRCAFPPRRWPCRASERSRPPRRSR